MSEVELYCTVGRGLLPFCIIELQQMGAKVIRSIEGKIFFTVSANTHKKPKLQTAERLLICAFHGPQTLDCKNKAITAFKLQRLLAEQINWTDHIKQWRLYHPEVSDGPLPFRANVKVTGHLRSILQPLHISRSFGQRIASTHNHLLQSRVRDALILIDIHIADDHITVGIALDRSSSAMGGETHGLRSTTASAMVMCLGKLSAASIVLDPMCGKGSLLYELPDCCLKVGIDIDNNQMSVAKKNVKNGIFILGDTRYLPFQSKSIDYILCDLPFGLQFSTQSELQSLLPRVITEMKRVIKCSGRIVLLTSVEQDNFLAECVQNDWTLKNKHLISLGALEAVINEFLSSV